MAKKTSHLPAQPCPVCGKKLDAASGDGSPRPGDYTICMHCTTILTFGENLTLVMIDEASVPASVKFERDNFRAFKKMAEAKLN